MGHAVAPGSADARSFDQVDGRGSQWSIGQWSIGQWSIGLCIMMIIPPEQPVPPAGF
jgi:hypothetical protein